MHRVFERCATPIGESVEGVWKAAIKEGNVFSDRGERRGASRDWGSGFPTESTAFRMKRR